MLYWLFDIYLLASILLSAASLCLWSLRRMRALTMPLAAVPALEALLRRSLMTRQPCSASSDFSTTKPPTRG